jgi:hypothetical protein
MLAAYFRIFERRLTCRHATSRDIGGEPRKDFGVRRVTRPVEPPYFLTSPRVLEERQQLLSYLRRDTGDRRQRRDNLNEDIFYSEELLGPLRTVFRGNRAFCEQEPQRGIVLHFRPLRYADEERRSELRYLSPSIGPNGSEYYLWLAFEWRNLFYACDACAKYKGNSFPIEGLRSRYLASYEDVDQSENRLLIDPTRDDPHQHLVFVRSGECVARTFMGHATKVVFDLDRRDLVAERSLRIQRLIHRLLQPSDTQPYEGLFELLREDAPHSGALHGFLKRVSAAWRRSGPPLNGRGSTFTRAFIRAVDFAEPQELEALAGAVDQVVARDELLRDDPMRFDLVPEEAHDVLAEPRPRYAAEDRELSSIKIRKFKAIGELTFEMSSSRDSKSGVPCMMILGENSTAKSSVLQAIALALIGSSEAGKFHQLLPDFVRSAGTERFDQLDQDKIDISLRFHHSDHLARFSYDPDRRSVDGFRTPSTVVLGYGPRRYFDRRQRRRTPGAAARVRTLFDPLATIPYPGDWLREQTGSRFDTIAAALRIVLALDEDDELIIQPDSVAVRANGRISPIESLSEGYRSVFVMTVDILRELIEHWSHLEQAQAVVLIDELETHLHPRWKMQVMTSLRRVLPRVQFIATTHDPLCLRGMDDGEVQVLQRSQSGQIAPLQGLPSVKGMTAEQLLTSDYFGLLSTADPSVEIELARLAGDVVRRTGETLLVTPSEATSRLITQLVVGDSPSEQIIHEALWTYLEQREARTAADRPKLRSEAVAAVVEALRAVD